MIKLNFYKTREGTKQSWGDKQLFYIKLKVGIKY